MEAIIAGFREIRSPVDASNQQVEIDRQAFQKEIRYIWEYLMGQQRNGNLPY